MRGKGQAYGLIDSFRWWVWVLRVHAGRRCWIEVSIQYARLKRLSKRE
jgi:hypothetical protein